MTEIEYQESFVKDAIIQLKNYGNTIQIPQTNISMRLRDNEKGEFQHKLEAFYLYTVEYSCALKSLIQRIVKLLESSEMVGEIDKTIGNDFREGTAFPTPEDVFSQNRLVFKPGYIQEHFPKF